VPKQEFTVDFAGARLALTFDDAPSMREPGLAEQFEPARMDRIREALQARGVEHAVAFVISDWARGFEEEMKRWLDAGYELGNHTADHRCCSHRTISESLAAVDRCDRYLEQLGAFSEGRERWFRFPHLDRGEDPGARAQLAAELRGRGYRIAGCSIDSFDFAYEGPLAIAALCAEPERERQILDRFARASTRSVRFQLESSRTLLGRDPAHSLLFHFGGAAAQKLAELLHEWQASGASFCSLDEAVHDPLHHEFDTDYRRQGLFSPQTTDRRIVARLRRRFFGTLQRGSWFEQRHLGPLWPHLS
jgi:peptidoglycan/xylan/chitin deacetylase (PgdA/CDA1 family)